MMHYVLFTGHMIDAADRKVPRFPTYKESTAKAAIKASLLKTAERNDNSLVGIAGGASGGDILFHELCNELGIASEIYLALPEEQFKQKSVSFAGENWEQRFDRLVNTHPVHLMSEDTSGDRSVWERANLWMLEAALQAGGENMTLIALWDGKGGDGKGGTEHMVHAAEASGANTVIIDVIKL